MITDADSAKLALGILKTNLNIVHSNCQSLAEIFLSFIGKSSKKQHHSEKNK